jgi:hypothetical protein
MTVDKDFYQLVHALPCNSYIHFKKSTFESLVLRQKYISLIHIGGYFTPVIIENETAICKFLFALAG